DDALLIAAAGVARDDAPPETHRGGVAQVFADLPASSEAAEDELHRSLADTEPPPGTRHEELRHPVLDTRLGGGRRRAQYAREAHGLPALQDYEWKGVRIAEPMSDLVRLAMTHL